MSKFNVGDRVIVVNPEPGWEWLKGSKGVVAKVSDGSERLFIISYDVSVDAGEGDEDDYRLYKDEQLELDTSPEASAETSAEDVKLPNNTQQTMPNTTSKTRFAYYASIDEVIIVRVVAQDGEYVWVRKCPPNDDDDCGGFLVNVEKLTIVELMKYLWKSNET